MISPTHLMWGVGSSLSPGANFRCHSPPLPLPTGHLFSKLSLLRKLERDNSELQPAYKQLTSLDTDLDPATTQSVYTIHCFFLVAFSLWGICIPMCKCFTQSTILQGQCHCILCLVLPKTQYNCDSLNK